MAQLNSIVLLLFSGVALVSCVTSRGQDAQPQEVYPHTDPENRGGWVLNESVSDEFEGESLDEDKWLIQGTDGEFRSNFVGRPPSQFTLKNAIVEDGKLKILIRWEPDYPFDPKVNNKGEKFENITTAAVISREQFYQGYMEIKAKAADASVASAFWMTGSASELDVFEHFGRPAQRHKTHLETEIWSSIHDWTKPPPNSVWTDRMQLPFRVAGDFHVYACEWNDDGLKFYVDGKQIRDVKKADAEKWTLTGPMWVWVDSETFPWHGLPTEEDLPADYEVEYIRIWQKPGRQSQ